MMSHKEDPNTVGNALRGVPWTAKQREHRRAARHGGRALQRLYAGRDISSDRLRPQHGFYDPPDPVRVRKAMWQRQIDALVIHQSQLPLLLADKLLDSRPVIVSE